jgi:nitroreductase/ubiquinone/menaquinone biosynthesis C-methylase UbiE
MELSKAIRERRSTRKFTNKKVSREIIEKLVDAANWAPSACNIQGWRFIVVDSPALKKKLVEMGGAVFIKGAPSGILVLYDSRTENPEYADYVISASAAAQNMLLMAHSLGLGACLVDMLPTKRQLRKMFKIPKHFDVIGYIALGYPDVRPKPLPRRKQAKELISYNIFSFEEEKRRAGLKRLLARIFYMLPTPVKKALRHFIERRFVKKFHELPWELEDVAKHWDATTDYDEINKKTYSYFRRFIDGYRLSNIKDNSYVLDICCRTGNGAAYFAERNKIKKAVCADVSKKMLKIAAARLQQKKVDFETRLFAKLDLPFKNNEFDAVLCFETVEHMPDPKKFIAELSRITKRGGEILITTPNWLWEPIHTFAAKFGIHHSEGPHRFLHYSEIKGYIKEAGLKIKREETTVLVACGPRLITKLGEVFEKIFKKTLMPMLGLRRIFVCEKV